MRDFKTDKPARVKGNRLKREKQPRDWRKLLHRLLIIVIRLTLFDSESILRAGSQTSSETIAVYFTH